ncbi:MAG: SiaC family regulatory phosphoprotein, partial [Bacteroidota bacterium]
VAQHLAAQLQLAGSNALVTWYHDVDDEDMKEAGEDFRLLVKIPIEIVGMHFTP